MSQVFINCERFNIRKLEKDYLIQVVNKDELDMKIMKETALMIMIIQNH